MDLFEAIKTRRSCRKFLPDPISEDLIVSILDLAGWAPSPMNAQPWEFVVITNADIKAKVYDEADRCRKWAIEKSGWKWLDNYQAAFLKEAPVLVGVIGDPKKTGLDVFQAEGGVGYQHACAAAIQNMQLAAHALGLGTLWFTLFDKQPMREILGVDAKKTPLALVCIGKPDGTLSAVGRKNVKEKIRFIR